MKNLTANDKNFYLTNGNLIIPFLDSNFVLEKVMCDYNNKREKYDKITKIDSLLNWMHSKTNFGDEKYNEKHKFQHTAEEIWQSKLITG